MFSIEQIIVVVFCIVACGYTSYKSGFDEGGKVTTVYTWQSCLNF